MSTRAIVTVELHDFRRALTAVRPHLDDSDGAPPSISVVRLHIHPDGNLYVCATDRYTAACGLVSIWEDRTRYGELVDLDLSADQVKDILATFRPVKDQLGDQLLELHAATGSLTLTDASGMFTVDPKQLRLPVGDLVTFPDIRRLLAAAARRARAHARQELAVNLGAIWASPKALRKFAIAGEQYGAIEQYATEEARSALLMKAGDSFLGLLMPIRPSDEDLDTSDRHLADWIRRLPEPLPQPVPMPTNPVDLNDFDGPGTDTDTP